MKVFHFLGIGMVPKRPMIDATGGTERVALEIARIQARRGLDVTIASMAPEAWQGQWEGVKLRHLKPYSWAKMIYKGQVKDFRRHLRLSAFIRSNSFDIVHLHEYQKTRFFVKQPKVMHFHNNPLDGLQGSALAAVARWYWQEIGKSNAQIAVSEFVANRLRVSHGLAGPDVVDENIVVNQSGVRLDELTPEMRREQRKLTRQRMGLKEADVLIMFAGAVRPEKGIVQLAHAFSRLSEEQPDACLAVAGGSDLWKDGNGIADRTEQEVRDILDGAIGRKRAFLLGIVSPAEINSYYAAADIFVVPSVFQETFGLVALEAFAAGVPVVAARSGGLPELVKHQENGLLVDQSDVDGLYLAIRELFSDSGKRDRLGREASRTVQKFSWETTVDRMQKIYRDVLDKNDIPRGKLP